MFLSLLLKRLLICLVCHRIAKKDEIEISELVEFSNKCLTEFFIFTPKRELDEDFLSFFK